MRAGARDAEVVVLGGGLAGLSAATALAEEGVYQFAYFSTPVPIRGATGSIGSPAVMW